MYFVVGMGQVNEFIKYMLWFCVVYMCVCVYVYFVFYIIKIVMQYWLIGWSNTSNQCMCVCVCVCVCGMPPLCLYFVFILSSLISDTSLSPNPLSLLSLHVLC